MKRALLGFALAVCTLTSALAETYYYNGSGAVNAVGSWFTNRDGTGSSPGNFTTAGNTFVIQNSQSPTLGGAWTISGSGSGLLIETGGAMNNGGMNPSLVLSMQSGATFTANGSHTGVSFGTINPNSSFVATSNFRPTLAYGSLTYQIGGNATPGAISTTGNFTVSPPTGELRIAAASAIAWNVGGTLTVTTNLNLASGAGNGTANIGGGLHNSGTISKTGAGTALVNFNGSGASDVTWGTHSGVFNVTIGAGKSITFLDDLTTSSGTMTVDGTLATTGGKTAAVATVVLSGGTINGAGSVNAGTSYNLQSGSASAVLAGSASASKTTGATVSLSGSNTYSGGTSISAGTLTAAHNSALGFGSVSVTGGTLAIGSGITLANDISLGAGGVLSGTGTAAFTGTLDGTGTISGSLLLGSGASLNPGNSPGILSNAGSLTFGTGSTYTWELAALSTSGAGTNFDQILNTGSITLSGGSLLLSLGGNAPSSDPYWTADRSWSVIASTGGGTLSGSALGIGTDQTLWSSYGVFSTALSGENMILSWTPIPEPSTYAAILGGLALLGVATRRRSRSATKA